MHPTTKKSTRILFFPLIKFCEWLGDRNPVLMVKLRYLGRFHRLPDLKNPKDLNEKILYMKLYTDTTEWTRLADKYKVRQYVEDCNLGQYLVKLYGAWGDENDIDFEALPYSFILKANNGDGKGHNRIITDKSKLDVAATKEMLHGWLHRKHVGSMAGDVQYKGIPPMVLAEELLPIDENQQSLVDYKIWCFNGKAHYIWTCSDRNDQGTNVMLYDREWNPCPQYCVYDSRYRKGELMVKPSNLGEMLHVAETLTKGFPCVRLDLYNTHGRIYFGEMTFTSLGGMMNYFTQEFLDKCGEMIDLNYKG